MTAPHVLAEYERTQILRQVVAAKVHSQTSVEFQSTGVSGTWSTRHTFPAVREWGTTWAEVAWANWVTNPSIIVANVVYTLFSCGLYLPWWFVRTLKKPPLSRVSIDEYGRESWMPHRIGIGQRVLTGVIFILILWWLGTVPQFLTSLGAMTR
jgi:hypothetical protein